MTRHIKITATLLALCVAALASPLPAPAVDMPAVKQGPVQWEAISGNYPVMDMRFIAPHRLLVTEESKPPVLLYDSSTGKLLWKYWPEGWAITYFDLVAAFSDLILIQENDSRDRLTTLAAVSGETGEQLWFVQYENKKRSFQFLPVPAAGIVLVVELEKKKATLRGLELTTGQEKWQQAFKIQKGGHPTSPLVQPNDILSFYGQATRIDPASGKVLWQRKDVVPDNLSPPAKLQNSKLHLIDKKRTLHILDPETGESILTAPLNGKARYTNIYPTESSLYLRGQDEDETWFLAKHDPKSGQTIWNYSSTQATVSNLVEDGSRLYVATAAKVLCLESKSGKEVFASPATLTGQSFPVRLRKYGNTVVYIGELMIAGFDSRSGKKVYKVGITPVSQETHLDAVDNWMSVLQNRIGKLSKAIWFSGAGALGDAFSTMSVNSQNLSNSYSNQASNYRLRAGNPYNPSASSDSWKSATSQLQSEMNSTFARTEAQLGFFFQMEGLKNAMLSKSIARDQVEVNRLSRIRSKILAAYSAAESDDYAWRAHLEGDWIGLNLVHLPTGKSTFTPYSPFIKKEFITYSNYNERTIWNLVDLGTGLVYHHALRIGGDNLQKDNKPGMSTYVIRLVTEKVKIP
jgi:outer membrane protein assembly factor BamB